MALKDRDNSLEVSSSAYVLLLEGTGIVTNLSKAIGLNIRFDTQEPASTDAPSRVVPGNINSSNSYINSDSSTKIYGKAESGTASVLVTENIE